MDLLTSAVILVACVSVGLCGIIISGRRVGAAKHTRAYVKDIQQDLNYVKEQKNNEIKELRHETLRLKGIINKGKQGATITDTDMKNANGIGEMLMQKLIPNKYHEIVKPLLPKAEAYLAQNQEQIIEQIKSINNKNQPKTGPAQTTTTL